MTVDDERPRRADLSPVAPDYTPDYPPDRPPDHANGGSAFAAAAPADARLPRLPRSASASAAARGAPPHLRLSAENRQLVLQLRRLEAELASLRLALTRATSDALTDALTGLANRRAFDDALEAAAARACEASPAQLLIADIDHFKALNDAHGHHFGDAVLRITGEMLKAAVRRGTVVARLGGDEFALLLAGPTAAYPVEIETMAIARRLCAHRPAAAHRPRPSRALRADHPFDRPRRLAAERAPRRLARPRRRRPLCRQAWRPQPRGHGPGHTALTAFPCRRPRMMAKANRD